MDFNSSALVAAWGSLPREPAIAYYGQDSLLEGIKNKYCKGPNFSVGLILAD